MNGLPDSFTPEEERQICSVRTCAACGRRVRGFLDAEWTGLCTESQRTATATAKALRQSQGREQRRTARKGESAKNGGAILTADPELDPALAATGIEEWMPAEDEATVENDSPSARRPDRAEEESDDSPAERGFEPGDRGIDTETTLKATPISRSGICRRSGK